MPVGEHLVVPTEHSYGDLLPEPGNATRPEPIDVVSKWLRDRVAGNRPQQGVKVQAVGAVYLCGCEDYFVELV